MLSNKIEDDSSNFDDMTILYKRFLRIIGLLPFEGHNFSYLGTRLLLVYFLAWTFVYCSMIMFYAINEQKIPTIDTICEMVVTIGVTIRYYLLIHHRSELTKLLDESRAIWKLYDKNGHRAVFQFERKVRQLFKLLLGSCILSIVMYSSTAIHLTLNATHLNDTRTLYLPFKWYSKDDANLWPGYKFNFVLQVLVGQNSCIVLTSIDTVAPLFIMMSAGYFRALRYRILRIFKEKNDPSTIYFELVTCIRLHQRILKFCSRIERIMSSFFLVQILGTVYNLSLAGIKLVGTDPDRYKFVSVALFQLGGLFICQWSPDYLVDESTAISTAVYFVSLTGMRSRLGKLLVLIIARSQRPVQITAAGMVTLSLENFRCMLTSAVSFFTVLKNINH